MTFIPARNFTPAQRQRIDVIVLHSAESSEKPGTARRVAQWFAGTEAPRASAHYCVDSSEVVQCVSEKDVAWGAPGANHNGVHIEHVGFAAQNLSQWADDESCKMLIRSTELCADLCRRWNIPPVLVRAAGLIEGLRGITTHLQVSLAFRKSDHTDPGAFFPIEFFCARVAAKVKVA